MRKTLQDVAGYLKKIMVPETYEEYEINPIYSKDLPEEDIRKGVLAFRAFLDRLYELLYIKGDVYDKRNKIPHGYENRISLSVYYPFLHNLSIILMKIGYYGTLVEDAQTLSCGNNIFYGKISVGKNLECMRFLTDCGICFEGIDINDKKQNISDIKSIKITYPDNPMMLTGLKVMATAEVEHGTLVNQNIFLRCDYRVLKKNEENILSIVKDTIKPLSTDVQNFILEMHERYIDKGFTCVTEIKGFHVYIKYCYKRKDLWGINASLNNGYHINVKPTKTEEYMDTIITLSPVIQKLIAKGYGCGRKREIGRCDGGCRGLPISLDESVLDIKDDIITWFDKELSCLQKK